MYIKIQNKIKEINMILEPIIIDTNTTLEVVSKYKELPTVVI